MVPPPPHPPATQPTSPLWTPRQLGYPVLISTSMSHLTRLLTGLRSAKAPAFLLSLGL